MKAIGRIIILLSVLAANYTVAQQTIRFNKQYNFGNTSGSYFSTDVFDFNNDYVLTGLLLNSSIGINSNAIGFIRTDSIGAVKVQKITKSANNYGFYSNGSHYFLKTLNKNIVFTGMNNKAYAHTTACLVRLNSVTGDTLWTKEYAQMSDTSYLFCSSELSDSSILSIGYKYFDNGTQFYNRPFIMKTDKNGNYKWHKWLWNMTASYYPLFRKLLNVNDKDFVVTGGYNYTVPGVRGFLLKFDTLGNIAFNQTYSINTYSINGFNDVIPLNDGNFLVSGNVTTYHNSNFTIEKGRPTLAKIDKTNGALLNGKLYGAEKDNGHSLGAPYQDPITLNIYASGIEFFAPSTFKDTFYKFNSNLDSIYSRYYDLGLGGTQGATSCIRTNDGGFAYAVQLYPATAQQKFCLMKTDTMGCDSVGGCVMINGINSNSYKKSNIKMYPSPVNDVLKLKLEDGSFNSEQVQLKIVTVLGQEVLKINSPVKEEISIDVKHLPDGIYFLQVFDRAS
ncbi:MAG: T9SS type A sorting domain-containing protein [Bacteroidetes bacterium]|nr:T9SS type A sorting domain-containing protein [Bacteroidota bacterium]